MQEEKQKKVNELADQIIAELTEAGFTPDEMLAIIREARRQFIEFKKRKQKKQL